MKQIKPASSIAHKITLITLVMVIFCTTSIGVFSYILYLRDSITTNAERARSIAYSLASSIDPEQFQEILISNTKNEYWHSTKAAFDKTILATDATFIYALDNNHTTNVKYFMTGLKPNDTPYADLGSEESVSVFSDEILGVMNTGESNITKEYYSEGYGNLVSGYAPIFDKDNKLIGVIGADLSVENVMRSANRFRLIIIIIVSGLSLVCALIEIWYIRRFVGKPINALTKASEKIAKGDMTVVLNVETNDEIGKLVESFIEMIRSTKAQVSMLETLANGDLTAEIEARCDKDAMNISIAKMTQRINSMLLEVSNSTEHVSMGANQISSAAQMLAQGATQQAATVENIGDSIAQATQKTAENTQRADHAATLANSIKNSAEKGSEQMTRMVQAVDEINEASNSISKVIKVIDDIAFQTNILALNAAVEAARAGQHGKGFAVVADEVRNLAAKSSEAAKNTSSLITDSIEKAKLGAQIANDTAVSLTQIVEGINESSQIMTEIARFSEEQGIAISTINNDISQVSHVVQQNSATAEESAASSQELSSQSDMLRKLVSRFKLNSAPNSSEVHKPINHSASGFHNEYAFSISELSQDHFDKY